MKIILPFFYVVFFIAFLSRADAYPTFIRLNYNSCLACHQAPLGGGPLTPYGKGIAYTESFAGGEYKKETPDRMEHSLETRLMRRHRLSDTNAKKIRIFPMQLDYTNVINWTNNFKQELTLAVAPDTARLKDNEIASRWTDRTYLRTFKVSYTFDKSNYLIFGGANLPLGVGLTDHTTYVREKNRLGVTDVPIQIQYVNVTKVWQQAYFVFGPNPNDSLENYEYGVATKQEYFPTTNLVLGSQALAAMGKSINRELVGIFIRTGMGLWSVLGEMNYTHRRVNSSETKFDQWTSFLEGDYYFKKYWRSALGFQVLRSNKPFEQKEELYSFSNDFKPSSRWTLNLEYRQKSTETYLDQMILGQIFLNWW